VRPLSSDRTARNARRARPERTVRPARVADAPERTKARATVRRRPQRSRMVRFREWLGERMARMKPGRSAYILAAIVLGLCGIGGLAYGGYFKPVAAAYESAAAGLLSASGMTVSAIDVRGRVYTTREELRAAIGVEQGSPILDFDVEAARARIEALAWVDDARVMRLLPGTIFVEIVEKRPFALWQVDGQVWLIEEDGGLITREDAARFAGTVPLVVGEGAESKVAELIAALAQERTVAANVASAVRVGGRRWDLILVTGARVKLPESNLADALKDLARLDAEQGLFAKDIESVDLRLPDRITVVPRAPGGGAAEGEDT